MKLETTGEINVVSENPKVVVLPYAMDDAGLLCNLGVQVRHNSFFSGGSYQGVIECDWDPEDESMLEKAKRALQEKTGYIAEDRSKWIYLCDLYLSDAHPSKRYCYAVNVTGMRSETPHGDFSMSTLQAVRHIPDTMLQALFMRLFLKLYQNFF